MPYIGSSSVQEAVTRDKYIFTSTAGQKLFEGRDDNNNLLTTSTNSDIYLNGVKLVSYSDYVLGKNSITLLEAAEADDVLEVINTVGTLLTSDTTVYENHVFSDLKVADRTTLSNTSVLTKNQAPYIGTDSIIRTNSTTISEDITLPANTNGISAGPITIANNVTVTIQGDWTIL